MGNQRRLLGSNIAIYMMAAAIICLNGLVCIKIITQAATVVKNISYYYMQGYNLMGLEMVWAIVRVITGIVMILAMLFLGVAAFCQKRILVSFGVASCAISYIFVIISDIILQAIMGGNVLNIFINIFCFALYLLIALALFADIKVIRIFLVSYESIALIIPAAIFVLTIFDQVIGGSLSFGGFLMLLIESCAQAGAIVIATAMIAEVVPQFKWHNADIHLNHTTNSESQANTNNAQGFENNINTSPFNIANSIQQPDGYRSVALVVIFSIITLGIYKLYWIYKVSEKMNRELCTGKSPVAQLLLFMFIPFYAWYWYYNMTRNVGNYSFMRGRNPETSMDTINLILAIFGLDIVAIALMQDMLNKAVGLYEGGNYQNRQFNNQTENCNQNQQ